MRQPDPFQRPVRGGPALAPIDAAIQQRLRHVVERVEVVDQEELLEDESDPVRPDGGQLRVIRRRHVEANAAITEGGLQCETWLDPALVTGDPVLLERLVGNLLVNAVKYNEPHGWIRIATGTRNGLAYLTLSNSGHVIPAEHVGSLIEPFRRLHGRTADGSGAGLGLAIVASVSAAHDGKFEATSRPSGGLDVTVSIPSVAAS